MNPVSHVMYFFVYFIDIKFATWHVPCYIWNVIVSFRHRGLKLFYEKGDVSKLQPQHVSKIRLILTRLDAARTPGELNVPGYDLHQLKGNMKAFWSVKVDKNYRIIFRLENENIFDVDYIDYH